MLRSFAPDQIQLFPATAAPPVSNVTAFALAGANDLPDPPAPDPPAPDPPAAAAAARGSLTSVRATARRETAPAGGARRDGPRRAAAQAGMS